ncbi:hypothetical protein FRB95_012589 [Tulasnella sp. JGI-2019a]|nr:hypothetical protein FRB95_012589 [Tulasnella sp. JGI-2019a]
MSQELARFRVLLIGRGNAGKTTILKKLCGETDVPIVRDRRGNLVSPVDSLNPSSERGNHDIEHEITYPSREKFAFHDSCGLESGSDVEMQRIADFIARRAKMSLENGLHAIWICIALDDSRPASRLFDITTGEVTTIFVFTKFDALETLSYVALIRQGRSKRQANAASSEYAEHVFQEQWIPLLKVPNPPPPPPYHVRLKGS